ncbi:hypothetical protein [Streptomyces chartreusis]|uniref:hypothetical protein n=1 Tax=Streptomyces chartreusis TaxID=1969 RepID=UPI00381E018D
MVQEEIEANPALRRELQLHLTAPGTNATGSLLITGSPVSRSSIALGPLTINNTRGGQAVIALVAALLLALVVYGGINLIVTDDSPESSQDDSARHAVRALNVSEVKRVVPDPTSMPSGWERSGSLAAGKDEDNGCSGAQARFGTNNWNDGSTRRVHAEFTVWSCPSAALSAKGFEETRSGVANNKAREISLPELGDQRTAITHYTSISMRRQPSPCSAWVPSSSSWNTSRCPTTRAGPGSSNSWPRRPPPALSMSRTPDPPGRCAIQGAASSTGVAATSMLEADVVHPKSASGRAVGEVGRGAMARRHALRLPLEGRPVGTCGDPLDDPVDGRSPGSVVPQGQSLVEVLAQTLGHAPCPDGGDAAPRPCP